VLNQNKNLKERLLSKIKVDDKGCWLWTGEKTTTGYGRLEVKRNKKDGRIRIRAHRLSYEVFKGNIEDGLLVCHSCDIKLCINPEHLWLGTHQENMEDAYKKGIIKKNPSM
jgi:hypothetical protein